MANFLFIPGMPKSGTSFLYTALKDGQLIQDYAAGSTEKEVEALELCNTSFDTNSFKKHFASHDNHKWYLDATPFYIFNPNVVDRIELLRGTKDNIQFIICLRERVDQIFSWYIHHISNHLAFYPWEKKGSTSENPFVFSTKNPLLQHIFKPAAPFLVKLVNTFGRDSITVFNHHSDYSSESPFWSELATKLGKRISKPDSFWSQNDLPTAVFFDRFEAREIDGVTVEFTPGDLIIANARETRLVRNVDAHTGYKVVNCFAGLSRTLSEGTISYMQKLFKDDFCRCIDVLGLSRAQFPDPTIKKTNTSTIKVDQLAELQRWPTSLLRSTPADIEISLQDGSLDRKEASRLISYSTKSLNLLRAERDKALAELATLTKERDTALAERDHARRFPWKYLDHAFAYAKRKHFR